MTIMNELAGRQINRGNSGTRDSYGARFDVTAIQNGYNNMTTVSTIVAPPRSTYRPPPQHTQP
ncbi:MAG: hypothetical protein R2857_12640 [Vampirovibrionales bacterium]